MKVGIILIITATVAPFPRLARQDFANVSAISKEESSESSTPGNMTAETAFPPTDSEIMSSTEAPKLPDVTEEPIKMKCMITCMICICPMTDGYGGYSGYGGIGGMGGCCYG
ncbi:hypothetical protein GCK32_012063 [Trichostrongylus colubriformis]|uniref:Uncharacterized protein n=1 Tax=Trichostrongylus colubriformis TaxID=6319 RepID=A0AAN8EV72_TRICO